MIHDVFVVFARATLGVAPKVECRQMAVEISTNAVSVGCFEKTFGLCRKKNQKIIVKKSN